MQPGLELHPVNKVAETYNLVCQLSYLTDEAPYDVPISATPI
jgi:hypothetical protein